MRHEIFAESTFRYRRNAQKRQKKNPRIFQDLQLDALDVMICCIGKRLTALWGHAVPFVYQNEFANFDS